VNSTKSHLSGQANHHRVAKEEAVQRLERTIGGVK
jgi:hypothetical protein